MRRERCRASSEGGDYGYFEANIKFHDPPGEWSAFWIYSPSFGRPVGDVANAGAEIDIVEHRKRIILSGLPAVDGTNVCNANVIWDGYG